MRIPSGCSQGLVEPIPYLHTQSMYVDEVSDQNLDLLPRWIFQHERLNEAFAHMRLYQILMHCPFITYHDVSYS